MNFSVVLTQFCNLVCNHCYLPSLPIGDKRQDDLDEEVCRKAFDVIGEQYQDIVDDVYLTGGEFLTLSYGTEVVDMARLAFPSSKIYAYTNGVHFLKNPELFNRVAPDVFHVGLDAWHNTVSEDGRSQVADAFLDYRRRGGCAHIILHWTRREGDEQLFSKFAGLYGAKDAEIEDRSLNTTTGRAKSFGRPEYRENEVWRQCDFGEHILLKYNQNCYSCHYSVPSSAIGKATDITLRTHSDELRQSALGKALHSRDSESFYRYVCARHGIEFSTNRCLLCEDFVNHGVDLFEAAEQWLHGAKRDTN